MKKIHHIGIIALLLGITSCHFNGDLADGYGNFEATEVTISAENNGKLVRFDIREGDLIDAGTPVGVIDTIPLSLKKQQLEIQQQLVQSKSKAVLSQIDVLEVKRKLAMKNWERIEKLYSDGAATQKQLDDIHGELEVVEQSIASIVAQNLPVMNELKSIGVQMEQIEDQLQKSRVINPFTGTVLSKYAEAFEVVSYGKPLYKIADLSTLELKVYISESQLSNIKLGQEVSVRVDRDDQMISFPGTISWIASESEFTPKIIQTKQERVALVYGVKVQVKNNGALKIGMPAELWLNN